jgi:hypothetical protein
MIGYLSFELLMAPRCDLFLRREHLLGRSVTLRRGHRPWRLSRLVTGAPTLICVLGVRSSIVPKRDLAQFTSE